MENKGNKIKIEVDTRKLDWEVPLLICLDKGKTEGGDRIDTYEDTYADNAS